MVHFPLTLINTGQSTKSLPLQGSERKLEEKKGSKKSYVKLRTEWFQQLQAVASLGNVDLKVVSVRWRSSVGVLSSVESSDRQFVSAWRTQFEWLSVFADQLVGCRVEVKTSGQSKSSYEFRRGNKGVGLRISVVTLNRKLIHERKLSSEKLAGKKNGLHTAAKFLL